MCVYIYIHISLGINISWPSNHRTRTLIQVSKLWNFNLGPGTLIWVASGRQIFSTGWPWYIQPHIWIAFMCLCHALWWTWCPWWLGNTPALTFSIQLSLGWCLSRTPRRNGWIWRLTASSDKRGWFPEVGSWSWWMMDLPRLKPKKPWRHGPRDHLFRWLRAWPLLESRLHWMRAGRDVVGNTWRVWTGTIVPIRSVWRNRLGSWKTIHPLQFSVVASAPSRTVILEAFRHRRWRDIACRVIQSWPDGGWFFPAPWRILPSSSGGRSSTTGAVDHIRKEGKQKIIGAWLVVFLLVFPSSNGMIRDLVT